MNRLFLVGNGFDLTHGLKTSYGDFINWYLLKVRKEAHKSKIYQDTIITLLPNYFKQQDLSLSNYKDASIHFVEQVITRGDELLQWGSYDLAYRLLQNNEHARRADSARKDYNLFSESAFFSDLLQSSLSFGWVNIEKKFYKALTDRLDLSRRYGYYSVDNIDVLNSAMELIKIALNEYLSEVYKWVWLPAYHHIFFDKKHEPYKTVVVNFNYTPLVRGYFHEAFQHYGGYTDLIHIHGELNSQHNPIIFGYGDEMDDNYSYIEKLDDNRYLKNMKSFGYGLTDRLWRLLDFIDTNDYEVSILGHSCGLSDRVLLNKIFEHDRCKKIRIYYNNNLPEPFDDFTNLYQNISRHFNKKQLQRSKVFPKDSNYTMPQVKFP